MWSKSNKFIINTLSSSKRISLLPSRYYSSNTNITNNNSNNKPLNLSEAILNSRLFHQQPSQLVEQKHHQQQPQFEQKHQPPKQQLHTFSDLNKMEVGDRMKSYEANQQILIQKEQPFIIRLDGHGFSKFTAVFKKPWDIRIHNAMIETATELLKTFHPKLVYTFSDEITLCFPFIEDPEKPETQAYAGKVQKLISLTAGFASTVFYKSIMNQKYDPEEKKLIERLQTAIPHFDSRIFTLPSNDEIIQNLFWRSSVDCRRNSVANLGHAHFKPKQMLGVSNREVKELLLTKGIDYDKEPDWYKFGVYLKKQSYTLNTVSRYNNEQVSCIRTRISNFSFDISKLENPMEFLREKSLPEDFNLSLRGD
ncbi:hypothetical protein CYY_005368 [Polysphondylium violaceum]|uniref:tRNAHis guanylyltransferase catalytic domain-containing protein n=1 Tax=Polysphondylium violaceum TaxID=133409 RepID=A0A8J4PT82_9MYCE|nr:hypothetical protein CYY_005368 [Polysphondylium violaceum]